MKRMSLIAILSVLVVGCGSRDVARPFVAQPVKTEKKLQKKAAPVEEEKPVTEAKKKKKKKSAKKEKAFAGKMTFKNLSQDELAAFRLIPENGGALVTPKNQSYDQVDGFWWQKGPTGEWFKIPDHSEVWIGQEPEKYEGTVQRDGLTVYYRSGTVLKLVGFLKNTGRQPRWVRDTNHTKSPVPSPWVVSQETNE